MRTTIKMVERVAAALLACAALFLGGCHSESNPSASASQEMPATQPGQPATGQPLFSSDTELADALVAAVKAQDHARIHQLLGPDWKELVSGDKTVDARSFQEFTERASQSMRLERKDDSTTVLHLGNDDWPYPIPLVKTPDGKWFLDTETGKQEVWARRIGKDELTAIAMCRLYVQAQEIYAGENHGTYGSTQYAQRVVSHPGQQDGVFWPVSGDQQPSPLAQVIAKSKLQDYQPTPGQHEPYHGYRFRVLKSQGPDAPSGERNYLINGNLVDGFALVAFPDQYEWTGVMTFIVNQDGKVYQKDLGPDTVKLARQMTSYNPDSSWTLVHE